MSDLISKSALKKQLREWLPKPTTEQESDCKWVTGLMLDAWVDSLPTIEPRHGKWTLIERREPQFDLCGTKTWAVAYRCSECGFIHTVIEDFGHYAFCPNCGARMERIEE